MKKLTAAIGIALLLGAGLGLAQEKAEGKSRAENRNQIRDRLEDPKGTPERTETRTLRRIRFMDENGDGINDLGRDHDGDGIPNGQDPDWVAPKDGTGYQVKAQTKAQKGQAENGTKSRLATKAGWSKESFRSGKAGMSGMGNGTGICNGTGPMGKSARKGRR